MEINSINELWLYLFAGIVLVIIFGLILHCYSENKRLKEKYPLYTKSQRWFMSNTVEYCDSLILDSLREKYKSKKGVVTREIKVVQKNKDSLVVHIYYKIPKFSEPLTVIFNLNLPNIFTYRKSNYQIANIKKLNIASIII
jgi:hypothetical protein